MKNSMDEGIRSIVWIMIASIVASLLGLAGTLYVIYLIAKMFAH